MVNDSNTPVSVNLSTECITFLDQLINEGLIASRSEWIRDATEEYTLIFLAAQKELKRICRDEFRNKPEINIPKIKADHKEYAVQYAIQKYAKRLHKPLGNIHHPEVDYTKPHYATPEVETNESN